MICPKCGAQLTTCCGCGKCICSCTCDIEREKPAEQPSSEASGSVQEQLAEVLRAAKSYTVSHVADHADFADEQHNQLVERIEKLEARVSKLDNPPTAQN